MLLLYDGSCALCRRGSERAVRWAAPGRLARRSFREPGVLEQFPQISAAACEQAMQLVTDDGRVFSGAEAAFRILATRWWLKPALWMYLLPGVRQLADAAYRWVAQNRHRLGGTDAKSACDDSACRVD